MLDEMCRPPFETNIGVATVDHGQHHTLYNERWASTAAALQRLYTHVQ